MTDLQDSAECDGSNPFHDGPARSFELLSAFNGESSRGTWTLHVTDGADGDTGRLVDWNLLTMPALVGVCEICEEPAGCPGQEMAPVGVRVRKGAAGSVVISYPDPLSACALGAQVRMSATARPAAGSGSFPDDPLFADVSPQDLDPGPEFRHVPPAGNQHYLVIENLPGGLPGPSGHYGR
jgi:hypothetical protein